MNNEMFKYGFTVFLSGLQVGFNPCSLVVLWGMILYLSHGARTPGLVAAGFWTYFLTSLAANALMSFGVGDAFLRRPEMFDVIVYGYALVAAVLIIYALVQLTDWFRLMFGGSGKRPVFKLSLPAFWDYPQKVSTSGRGSYLAAGCCLAVILNLMSSAWGHDYSLYVSFSQIYNSLGAFTAFLHAACFWAGYFAPMMIVGGWIGQTASFQGYETVPEFRVSTVKMMYAVFSLAIGVVLLIYVFRGFETI